MTKKIIQISPFSFDHLGGVEKYAEILDEIFTSHCNQKNNSPERGERNFEKISRENNSKNSITTLCGEKDFPIFEPVKNCPVPKIWQKDFWKPFNEINAKNTKIIISHIRFAPTAWLAFWLAKRKNIPYIHIEHGTGFLIHKNFLIKNIAKLVDLTIGKRILKHADFVVCASKSGENWIKKFAKRSENITTIYRGFHTTLLRRRENMQTTRKSETEAYQGGKSKDFISQNFDLENTKKNFKNTSLQKNSNIKITPLPPFKGGRQDIKIGFVGRLVPLKNVNTLIEALKNLKHLNWQCTIIGDGEMRGEWGNLVKKYQLENKIIFAGSQEHAWILENFYPKIDIFVNPSLQEGLPTTVIEAKIAGCEVLATNVGGTNEIPHIHLCEPTIFSLTKNLEKLLTQNISKSVINSQNFPFTKAKMKENFETIFNYFSGK